MKRNRILKIIVITLLIILLSIISFGGIFVENKNTMKNLVADYQLSRELTGSRRVELNVDKTVNTVNFDADGNIIEDDGTSQTETTTEETTDTAEGNTDGTEESKIASTEEVPVNREEVLTVENYRKSKSILEKRLKDMGANDYTIRLNEENGTILFEIPEDENTDLLVSQLSKRGEFKIIDADTKEILMTNEHLESVTAGIQQVTTGYQVVMQFRFNSQGTEKLKEITNTYVESEDEEGNTTSKKISLQLDGEELLSSSFNNEISNGIMQLTIGNAGTDINSEEMQSNYMSVVSDAEALNTGKLPIVYTVGQNRYVTSNISSKVIEIAIYVTIGIIVVGLVYLIIKYKKLGLLGAIAFIGYVALLLIVVRYTNVSISVAGMFALLLSVILNYIITIIILTHLKNEDGGKLAFGKAVDKIIMIIIPAYIIAIVFTFANSFGMVMFWGLTVSVLYNYIVTRTLLVEKK